MESTTYSDALLESDPLDAETCDICGLLYPFTGMPRVCLSCQTAEKTLIRLRKYGLSFRQWALLYRAQEQRCAICRIQLPLHDLHIDHDHATEEVRGLLCRACNHGLGVFKDNKKALRAAAAYLKTPPARTI
jgi:hypothetical protein